MMMRRCFRTQEENNTSREQGAEQIYIYIYIYLYIYREREGRGIIACDSAILYIIAAAISMQRGVPRRDPPS